MNKKKKKRLRGNRPFYMIVIVFLLYISWILIDQQIKLHELNNQKGDLMKEVERLREKEQQLTEEQELLNDPQYIERVARERLKMVKPNEIIYIDHEKTKFLD